MRPRTTRGGGRWRGGAAGLVAALGIAAGGCGLAAPAVEHGTPEPTATPSAAGGREIAYAVAPTTHPASSPALLERGAALYAKQCAACHGAGGKGDGPAAYLLYPKARDFTAGKYRFVSTWEGVPTDDDLYRVVSRGIPGSSMPSWAHLAEADRWALVHFLRTLNPDAPSTVPASSPGEPGGRGTGVIIVPQAPPYDAAAKARAKDLFAANCAVCHGAEGRGDGVLAEGLRDERNVPIRPRDFHSGVFKSSAEPERLYRLLVSGVPGTPMPPYPQLQGDDAWRLVRYVLDLSSPALRERNEMKRYRIRAARVDKIPDHPDDALWREAEPVDLHMMPLWWRYTRPEYLTVQALHDGNELALMLMWADDTHDARVVRPQDFRDAAAAQFALEKDPPFFAMGEPGAAVNIWMWKSERQEDLDRAFGDIDAQYPNLGVDSYPNLEKSPLEQPARYALTLDSDKTFVTGWGAGNVVSDPTLADSVEDLRAEGQGTLKARPRADQNVRSKGVYALGSYRVLFRRALDGQGEGAVTLRPGEVEPVAFAVWNGSAGDRDGKKSVTIWQDLALDR